MTKTFEEMRKVDISKYVKKRDDADNAEYLSWADCVVLLHQNGAEKVYFEALTDEKGSSLFKSDKEFKDKYGNTNCCYEVAVKITIDDDEFIIREPLMNGTNPVKDNSLTQQRVGNAQKRAFVKGVAIRTGLGFDLWRKDVDDIVQEREDLSSHSLRAIKQRLQEEITELMKRGYLAGDIARECGYENEEDMRIVFSYFTAISSYEHKLIEMLKK